MKYWPVPNSYRKTAPAAGSPGSFWEDRGDRYHCGVDIYAAEQNKVVSIEEGRVIGVGIFTSPEKVPYWNTTWYIVVEHTSGPVCRYAELGDVLAKAGDVVNAGQSIGKVGRVLNTDNIKIDSPPYIRKIAETGIHSMLHFEVWKTALTEGNYLGGNWFTDKKPENLLDPTDYLRSTSITEPPRNDDLM